jgi:hypothetical protein
MRRFITRSALLLLSFTLGVTAAHFLRRPPETRRISIETFRYGFSPSRIHANRGDRLLLTFSTRDTGQSFFLQDYDLHVVISPGTNLVEVYRLSRPDDPPARLDTVELTAGLPGWGGLLVSKSQFRNHTYNGPMHGTERGDLVVAPNYLLGGALGLLFGIPFAALAGIRVRTPGDKAGEPFNLFERLPWQSNEEGSRQTCAGSLPISMFLWAAAGAMIMFFAG